MTRLRRQLVVVVGLLINAGALSVVLSELALAGAKALNVLGTSLGDVAREARTARAP